MTDDLRYRRILIKLSGEALAGNTGYGIDQQVVAAIVKEIIQVKELGAEIAMVCGAGNLFRGAEHSSPKEPIHALSSKTPDDAGFKRATGDYMGMLATIMNALALQNQFENFGIPTRLQSAIHMPEICEPFILRRALRHLEKGRIVIFGGGTGHPFFTTDTAAALRAVEINADVILKATKVDGVYDKDPKKHSDAKRFERISYEEVLENRLKVMDSTAISLCMDNSKPIVVFDFFKSGNLVKIVKGNTSLGTIVGG